MLKRLALLALVPALCGCLPRRSRPPEPPAPGREPVLRVSLGGAPFALLCPAYIAYDADSGAELRRGDILEGAVSAGPGGIRVGESRFPARRVRVAPALDGALKLNGTAYRGELVLTRTPKGEVSALNLVPMEAYLAGVLGSEIVNGWPPETLKAQAVAARTYALLRAEQRASEAFDLVDDVMDQKYEGRLKETPETRRAASGTSGRILAWRGRPFFAYYSAVCGGRTGDVLRALGREPWIPPLAGRPCPYCGPGLPPEKRGYYRWRKAVPLDALGKALGLKGALVSIRPLHPDAGGHACRVRIVSEPGGPREMDMLEVRRAAGILSNAWRAEVGEKEAVFDGKGFGHGVGLCQWGAKRMGEEGQGFEEILRFYYPGADLARRY